MYSLICGDVDKFGQPDFLDEDYKWETTNAADDRYSESLRTLIMSCIEWQPSKRVTLDDLHRLIFVSMGSLPDAQTVQYLENAHSGIQFPDQARDLWYPQDAYQLGFALPGQSDATEEGEQRGGASYSYSSTRENIMRDVRDETV